MIIFARKHFAGGKAKTFSFLIHLAIYIRAFAAILSRFLSRIYLPLIDAILIFCGYLLVTPIWEKFKYSPDYYPPEFIQYAVPVYILIFLGGILFSGGYQKPAKLFSVIRGLVWGTIAILLAYSLVDEKYRFSRALILLGSGWSIIILPLYRILLSRLKINNFRLDLKKPKRIAVVGHPEEVGACNRLT